MPFVLLRVVRFVRGDAVGGDEGAVNDDEVAFTQADEGLAQARRPGGEEVEGFVDVPPGRRLRHPEAGSDLRERLVLPQMRQDKEGLFEATETPPRRG
ncbi:putative hypothetical protein [Streptomyces sp. NBRC 110611]|nr:putative hypothetical protein [Streptomyces sp. NBRC 110611]